MFLAIFLILLLVLLALLAMSAYNGFEQLRNQVAVARRPVEEELARREELRTQLAAPADGTDSQLGRNPEFASLQQQLAQVDDLLAASGRYYNANVRYYNSKVQTLPASFVASLCKFEEAAYFEDSDQSVRSAKAVSLGGQP